MLGLLALALAIVVSVGDDDQAAPQAPQFGIVNAAASECFGERVGFVQSGVFLNLHRVTGTSAELGDLIGAVRLDGAGGTGAHDPPQRRRSRGVHQFA